NCVPPRNPALGAANPSVVPHMEQYRRWLAFSALQRGQVFFALIIKAARAGRGDALGTPDYRFGTPTLNSRSDPSLHAGCSETSDCSGKARLSKFFCLRRGDL